jgi:N-acylneuraminate cytidylyltransferase
MLQPKYFDTRSQDLEKTWHDAGQFYWGKSEAWLSNKIFFEQHAVPIILPRHRVQDIDTFEDWKRAEFMFEALTKS